MARASRGGPSSSDAIAARLVDTKRRRNALAARRNGHYELARLRGPSEVARTDPKDDDAGNRLSPIAHDRLVDDR